MLCPRLPIHYTAIAFLCSQAVAHNCPHVHFMTQFIASLSCSLGHFKTKSKCRQCGNENAHGGNCEQLREHIRAFVSGHMWATAGAQRQEIRKTSKILILESYDVYKRFVATILPTPPTRGNTLSRGYTERFYIVSMVNNE